MKKKTVSNKKLKKKNLFYKKLLVTAVAGIIVLSAGFVYTHQTLRSQVPETTPVGWMWNAFQFANSDDAIGLGWTSLNCLNDFDNDGLLENRCDQCSRMELWSGMVAMV